LILISKVISQQEHTHVVGAVFAKDLL